MFKDKIKTVIYAPCYYKDFVCISDKCKNSCCINWEICIDNATWQKYKNMDDVSSTVNSDDDCNSFILQEDGRCPHLNDDGLCSIILKHGEEYLSEICKKHPRFYNYINSERIEAGLGIVCEEACRIILENEKPFNLCEIEYAEEENDDGFETDFNALTQRDKIISIIEEDGEYENKIELLKSRFNLPEIYSKEEWLERYLYLEVLDEEWEKDLQAMRGRVVQNKEEFSSAYGKYYKKLLVYFVYRHVSVAESKTNLRARLAFCILSVDMIRTLFEENASESVLNAEKSREMLIDWARRYSSEIEYSADNTDELIFAFESKII